MSSSSSSNPYIIAATAANVPGLLEWAVSTELFCESVEEDARLVAAALASSNISSSSCIPSSSCVELSAAHPDLLSRALRWAVSFTNAHEGPLLPNNIRLRVASAHPKDVANIHRFVTELADFEKEPLEVKTTPEIFLRDGFGPARQFHCVFAEIPSTNTDADVSSSLLPWISHTPIAMALAHSTYSTWHGPTVYVEDIYVKPQGRRQGLGERLFICWARATRAAHATRLQWSVLDWNVGAIALYETKIKAEALKEWTLYRLYKDGIERIADNTSK